MADASLTAMQDNAKTRTLYGHWLILGIALLFIGAAGGLHTYQEHHRIRVYEEQRLLVQARVVQENVSQTLLTVNQVLLNIRDQLPVKGSAPAFNIYLRTLTDAMPGVRTALVVNAQGDVIATSRREMAGLNLAGREYFRTARQNPDADMLYVSPPFNTVLGVYSIAISKMVTGPKGEFAGLVVATLDPEYFGPFLDSVRYTPDMMASIVHWNGTRFMVRPEQKTPMEKNLAKAGTFFIRHRESGMDATVFSGLVYATGDERMIAQRTVRPAGVKIDQPIVVAANRTLDGIYATWRDDFRLMALLYGIVLLTSVAGLYAYQRKYAESVRKEEDAARRIASSERFMKTLTDHIPGMVAYWTDDLRCRFSNVAYHEWFGKTPEQMHGVRIQDVLGEELFRKNEPYIRAALRGERQQFERTLTSFDGRTRHTLTQYIPDMEGDKAKGFVVLVSDVTRLKQAEQELERLAQTDFLTALANRRHFMALAEQELARARRYGGALSVLMVDIDHFKKINDTCGHTGGDAVLREFADLCRRTMRSLDIVGRLGGEEFGVVLPQTDESAAIDVAERLRDLSAKSEIRTEKGQVIRFTVSIGVAGVADCNANIDDLLSRADSALYEAKNTGRNKVRVHASAVA